MLGPLDDELAPSPGLRGRSCLDDPDVVGLRRGKTISSSSVDCGNRVSRSCTLGGAGAFSCLDVGRGIFGLKTVLK